MEASDGGRYRFKAGLHWVKFYPVEGDTAIAELMRGDEIWGDLRLEGINLCEVGEARVSDVRVVLRLFAAPTAEDGWEFDLGEAQPLLAEAREWLLENERGRLPEGD